MTIEEAIKVQKWLGNNHFLFASTFEDVKVSTNMAIKSLEAWEKVKEEIKFIQEAEIQVYGKANWNFSGKCLDVIDKHLSEVSE